MFVQTFAIEFRFTLKGRGAVARGEEAGGWCGAWVSLPLLSDTAPLLRYSGHDWGLTPKPEATPALVT